MAVHLHKLRALTHLTLDSGRDNQDQGQLTSAILQELRLRAEQTAVAPLQQLRLVNCCMADARLWQQAGEGMAQNLKVLDLDFDSDAEVSMVLGWSAGQLHAEHAIRCKPGSVCCSCHATSYVAC